MGTAFIMNHTNIVQQQQHVTVRPIQQKAQYVVRPNEQSHSIGSGMFILIHNTKSKSLLSRSIIT
jgi:hypothetical protein